MTILVPPPKTMLFNGQPLTSRIREAKAVDRFAAELAQAAGCAVPIIEGSLSAAPQRGFILVYESWELDTFLTLGPRIVLLDAERGDLWSGRRERLVTDRCHLAAAVECLRYIDWKSGHEGGGGIHGLTSVAERAGMRVGEFRSPASDYGVLSCLSHCRTLAELLVHYLTVYEEMGLDRRTPSACL